MRAKTRWIAGLSAAAMLITSVATASAYTGQVAATATIAVRGSVTCDSPFTLTATFIDVSGVPVDGLSVDWTFVTSPSTADRINRTPSVTNANGVATTTVSLAPVNGERRIRATAGEVSASVVVTQACGGLPRTSTVPETTTVLPAAVLLLAFVSLAGGILAVRRRA